jgi:hypothetical protein
MVRSVSFSIPLATVMTGTCRGRWGSAWATTWRVAWLGAASTTISEPSSASWRLVVARTREEMGMPGR